MRHQVTSRCPPQHTLPPAYEVFVGRQPIYTQQLDVFAYELLFRSGEMQHANVTDGNQATARSSRTIPWFSQQTGWGLMCWKMSL